MGRRKTRDTIPVAFRLLRPTKWEIEGYAERHGMTQAAVVELAVSLLVGARDTATALASGTGAPPLPHLSGAQAESVPQERGSKPSPAPSGSLCSVCKGVKKTLACWKCKE